MSCPSSDISERELSSRSSCYDTKESRKLSLQLHPDKNPGCEHAATEKYNILMSNSCEGMEKESRIQEEFKREQAKEERDARGKLFERKQAKEERDARDVLRAQEVNSRALTLYEPPKKETKSKKKKKKAKRVNFRFDVYIKHIFAELHNGDRRLGSDSIALVNQIMNSLGRKLSKACVLLLENTNKNTLSNREAKTAIQLVLPPSIVKDIIKNVQETGEKYLRHERKCQKRVSQQEKAGLVVSVPLTKRMIASYCKGMRVGTYSSVYFACVLECICERILDASLSEADKRVTVKQVDVVRGIRKDEDMNQMVDTIVTHHNRDIPFVHPKLKFNFEDSETDISEGSIKRLAMKAGVYRLKNTVYDEVESALNRFGSVVMQHAVTFCDYDERKTLSINDLLKAMTHLNQDIHYALPRPKRKPTKKKDKVDECSDAPVQIVEIITFGFAENRKKKLKKYALQEMENIQNNDLELSIPKESFKRWVKDLLSQAEDCQVERFSKHFLYMFQAICEKYIINLFEDASKCTLHRKSTTLSEDDIELVLSLRNEF